MGQGCVFTHVGDSVHRRGGGIPACIAGGIPACLVAGLQGGWYPSMSCRFPGPHPGGKLRGLARRGVSRPTPKGEVEGFGLGGLQAHTQGVSRPTPSMGGCIPACTEADPPMATAAGGTHPTGMHSCFVIICLPFIYSGFI